MCFGLASALRLHLSVCSLLPDWMWILKNYFRSLLSFFSTCHALRISALCCVFPVSCYVEIYTVASFKKKIFLRNFPPFKMHIIYLLCDKKNILDETMCKSMSELKSFQCLFFSSLSCLLPLSFSTAFSDMSYFPGDSFRFISLSSFYTAATALLFIISCVNVKVCLCFWLSATKIKKGKGALKKGFL